MEKDILTGGPASCVAKHFKKLSLKETVSVSAMSKNESQENKQYKEVREIESDRSRCVFLLFCLCQESFLICFVVFHCPKDGYEEKRRTSRACALAGHIKKSNIVDQILLRTVGKP